MNRWFIFSLFVNDTRQSMKFQGMFLENNFPKLQPESLQIREAAVRRCSSK